MRRKVRRLTASILNTSGEFWHKAHRKAADGILRKTNVIYNKISWRSPGKAENFLRSALACNRRNEIHKALYTLEVGLNEYPGAESLLANYLQICCEQEQLLRFIDFINPTKKQICETLSCLHILDSPSDQHSIDGRSKHGTVWLTQDIINKNFGDDVLKLWCLADLLDHAGKLHITKKLHQRITSRPTNEPDDYLYGGVSAIRLGNIEGGFRKLELGLTAYPESEALKSVFKDCCFSQIAFDRYLRFQKILAKDESDAISALDFYYQAFRQHAPEAFIVKFKEAELDCNAADLLVLQEAFLAQLREKGVTLEKAKLCLFLSRFLGLNAEFSKRIFLVLSSLDWGDDDKTEKYILMLIYKLALPLVPNYDFDSEEVMNQFVIDAQALALRPITLTEPISDFSKHYWAVWQSFLCLVSNPDHVVTQCPPSRRLHSGFGRDWTTPPPTSASQRRMD